MKINNICCLVSSITKKENQNTHLPYWAVGLVSLDGEGTSINVNVKDESIANRLKLMFKYDFNLSLSSSQYGLKVEMASNNPIAKELGSILGNEK
ncbi:hypothetical protein [Clostridium sp. LP20]|uniref:hypothetical protein n=1 Tax=Clostridium sp. LP20 TaxID=3418665 RepID=UPI003EE43F9A